MRLILCIALLATLFGCDRGDSDEYTAVAAAQAQADGTVRAVEPSDEQMNRINSSLDKLKAIDQQHPRGDPPQHESWQAVEAVLAGGLLKLVDGSEVAMDGVHCDAQGEEYLRRVLVDPTVKIAVLPSTDEQASPLLGEVWIHSTDLDSYSNIVETAITSGWCTVIASPTNPHNDRYAALAEAFQSKSH